MNGNEITDYLLQCVDDCNEYEIPTMIVHIISGENPPIANMIGINRIRQITERAEQQGVNVALENLRNIENLGYVFDHINSSRLGFCFDSRHQNYRSKNTDLLTMYGDKLMALHLHDNDESADQHRMPFDGNINWDVVMKKLTDEALAAIYDGTSDVEDFVTGAGARSSTSEVPGLGRLRQSLPSGWPTFGLSS